MKIAALERFASMRSGFDKLRKAFEKSGYDSPLYRKAQHALSAELMTVRFTVKTIDRLCTMLRAQVDEVRRHEREIRRIAVERCGMPQQRFIEQFPANALNLAWVQAEAAAGKPYSVALGRSVPAVQELQPAVDLQSKVVIPLDALKAISKKMSEASVRRGCQEGDDRVICAW
jgi:RNA polymerase primary sigma factor